MVDVNLTGVWHTAKAAIPHLIAGGRGGSIVLTSSAAGLQAYANIAHYVSAKHGVVGLMRTLALELAPQFIRVNSIHPTQVDTPMIQNEATYRLFRPDLDHPTRADFEPASQAMNVLPIPWVDAGRHQQRGAVPGLRRGPLHHRGGAAGGRRLPAQVTNHEEH